MAVEITDKQRREAAARMRKIMLDKPDVWLDDVIACAVYDVLDDYETIGESLASLIDRPTTTRHGKFRTKYGRETPCCEVCGYSIGDMRWNYCPKCGAMVFEKEEDNGER